MNLEKVLVLSPHTDDAELGCGGFLNKLYLENVSITFIVHAFVYDGVNLMGENAISRRFVNADVEATLAEPRRYDESRQDILHSYVDAYKRHEPDLVLLPSGSDIHQDHQVVHQEGVRAFSKRTNVLAYELPWNSRAFEPNFFVELEYSNLSAKLTMLQSYESQRTRYYFDEDFIVGLAKVRGQQSLTKYAEAYELITWKI